MSSFSRISKINQQAARATRGYATSGVNTVSLPVSASKAASVSVFVKAGSRYETAPGLAHVLRNSLFKDTSKRSAIGLVREIEFLGGVLSTSLTRESLILTADFSKEYSEIVTEILGDALTAPTFRPHEYSEQTVPQVAADYEAFIQDIPSYTLDLLHSVAFRNGLGNSLFASPSNVVSHEALVNYAQASFGNPGNITVVGSNVDESVLANAVSSFFVGSGGAAASSPASKYYGGDIRLPGPAHSTSDGFAVAFEGSNKPELDVLKFVLGGESFVKYAAGQSLFSQLATPSTSVKAFNLKYSDAGLFGFFVGGKASEVEKAASGAVAALKKVAGGELSKEALSSAIAKAKFELYSSGESREGAAKLAAAAYDVASAASSLDAVSVKSVTEAAAALLKSKPSTVAVGNTHVLPFPDQLL